MKLSFYRVDPAYCDYLRRFDERVPHISDRKQRRPFVGILISKINNINYFAPLTSPKAKHIHMKNQVDFLKIKSGALGAINFNNMIPINKENLNKINLKISDTDTKAEKDYKNLLVNQLSWCTENRDNIIKKATKLYNIIIEGKVSDTLIERCCDFRLLEQRCVEYAEIQKAIQEVAPALEEKAPSSKSAQPGSMAAHIHKAEMTQSKEQTHNTSKTKSPKSRKER